MQDVNQACWVLPRRLNDKVRCAMIFSLLEKDTTPALVGIRKAMLIPDPVVPRVAVF